MRLALLRIVTSTANTLTWETFMNKLVYLVVENLTIWKHLIHGYMMFMKFPCPKGK